MKRVEFTKLFLTGHLKGIRVVEALYTSFPEEYRIGMIRTECITGNRYIIVDMIID
jgi:hypothetical protein